MDRAADVNEKVAVLVQDNLPGFRGRVKLYKLTPPIALIGETSEYVVASAADTPDHGPETMLFASDAKGKPTTWEDLANCSGYDHAEVLRQVGYAEK